MEMRCPIQSPEVPRLEDRIDRHRLIDAVSKTFILLFGLTLLLLATLTPTYPIGESCNYMLATISLEHRGSLFFTAADVAQAQTDFPEHADFISACFNSRSRFWITPGGELHCFYFSVYSLACIPAKKLLAWLGLSQSYAFAVTNVLLYTSALAVVYGQLKAGRKTVLLIILLLACSPTVLYYFWPGAEICIFSLLVISLVFFSNQQHKRAAFFVSIAGMLNPTVMAFGLIIVADRLLRLPARNPQETPAKPLQLLRANMPDLFQLALAFTPCLLPPLYFFTRFGVFVPTVPGTLRTAGYAGRFLAYLTDLNFGILPYFPVAFALLIAGVLLALFRKRFRSLLLPAAFLLTITAYCINNHINCGMNGIHRYNAWSFPIMIFFLALVVPPLLQRPLVKRAFYALLTASALLSAVIVWMVRTSPTGMIYTSMGPLASWVLDHAPRLYAPYPSTFISRTTHVDGGYAYTAPVIYYNADGYARKILVTPDTASQVLALVSGNDADKSLLEKKVAQAQRGAGFQYINVEAPTRLIAR